MVPRSGEGKMQMRMHIRMQRLDRELGTSVAGISCYIPPVKFLLLDSLVQGWIVFL